MKQSRFEILENTPLTEDVRLLRLSGDASAIRTPGQFATLKVPGFYLRRPFSVHDFSENEFSIVYKLAGNGTEELSRLLPGETLEALTGLGNGYDTSVSGLRPLLVGGGTGLSPMLCLTRRLAAEGKRTLVLAGFASKKDVFGIEALTAAGAAVTVTTADGSFGTPGLVTDAFPAEYSYVYACGPEPMLKAVCRRAETGVQVSLEARMGCGFGACMGCTCETVTGGKRICREGPVFRKEELLWEA